MSAFEPRIEYCNGFKTDCRRRYSTGNNREQFIDKLAILTISCNSEHDRRASRDVTAHDCWKGGEGGGLVYRPAARALHQQWLVSVCSKLCLFS